jgi:hypothetical protein
LLPVEDDTSFDYMNHETLQDTDDEIDRHPLQDTDDELDPLHDTEDEMDRDDISFDYMNHETLQDTHDEIGRHPLQDTDDELDPLHDTEVEMDRDVGKNGKRLLSTRRPIVDVRVMPSYRHEAFSQHSQIGGGGNQSKRAKRSLLTTRTGEPIADFEYAINMIGNDLLVAVSVASPQPFAAW